LSAAARELIHSYPDKAATLAALTEFRDNIIGAISDLCTLLHGDFPDFCAADYFIELAAHVWMNTLPDQAHQARIAATVKYLGEMARWMGADGMRGLTASRPLGRQLIDIYDAVRSRVPKKVFLARWYPKAEEAEQLAQANYRLEALKRLVEDELGLELVDLGSEEGGSKAIHEHMYREIGGSEIFIADLTGLRPNVMIELGYALHHLHTGRLILMFKRIPGAERVPFDTSTFRYKEITEAASIPTQIRGDLEAILAEAGEGRI
jgi:hypothetical protein